MFIDFAGMMTNINYIINIYKIDENTIINKTLYKIIIKYNNIKEFKLLIEYYSNIEERNKRFDEIIKKLK